MQSKTHDNKVNKTIEYTLKNLNDIIDVNTVIGKPIESKTGEIIVPISKVTLGLLVGGGEYGKVSIFKKDNDLPYSAGNGAVISIKPCGFLINSNGDYKIINVAHNSYEKLIDKTVDFVEKMSFDND